MKSVPTITKEMLASESFKEMLSGVLKACEVKHHQSRDRYEMFGEQSDFSRVLVQSAVRETLMICEEDFNGLLNMVVCYQEEITPTPLQLAQFMKTYSPIIELGEEVFGNQRFFEDYMDVMGEIVPFLFQVILMSEFAKGNVSLLELDPTAGVDTDGNSPFHCDDDRRVIVTCPF